MAESGFEIIDALVIDVAPDASVKESMNTINSARRLRIATTEKAEAEKIQIVKNAEGDAESKYLQGYGLARQRKAILAGVHESVALFEYEGVTRRNVMDLLLLTQYFETMKDLTSSPNSRTVFYDEDADEVIASAAKEMASKPPNGKAPTGIVAPPSMQDMRLAILQANSAKG
eukprot:GHVT01069148.1.p2 GENE.GHVT01069148.1~~GHVT01069148.1.p2  ORF type:complete len:173 (-),score=34.27 GHVT01069148.1:726-1244(-)